MKAELKQILLGSLALLVFLSAALAQEFFVHDGDRVVFLGDSITEQRLYTTYIEAYTLARHPDWKLSFRNVGWGGDTAWLRQRSHPDEKQLFAAEGSTLDRMVTDAVARGLGRDVLPLKPTVVTIKFGMNDHSYQPFREDIFRAYARSQTELAKVLEANGARVAFLTPQPIEEKRPDPDKDVRNLSLRKFSDGLKQVAEKEHALYVDQFDPYLAVMMKERASDPTAFIGGGDAVHPGPIGHTVMAWAVLKGLGATPGVSKVKVDADAKSITAEECRAENLKISNGTVQFDRTDNALPMPIDERAETAIKLAPVLDDLSQYELQVTGLKEGTYNLKIDSEPAGTFTAAELAKGCNLTLKGGPVTKQARELLQLVFKKNNSFFTRWRGVQLYEFPGWTQGLDVDGKRQAELARLDKEVADLEAQIETVRKPKTHHFELTPQ